MEALIKVNPDLLNARDDSGMSALHWGADREQLAIVQLILSYETVEVNATDQDGMTPLHYAATCDHLAIAEQLVQAGADPNASDADGETPLSSASSDSMRALLSAG